MESIRHVCIIGGGFCGTMVAAGLRRAGFPGRISLVEKEEGRLGRGVAYSPPHERLLLNVPARNMGAWPDAPGHFLEWLLARGQSPAPGAFLSRRLYGEYLHDQLQGGQGFDRIASEAIDVARQGDDWCVSLANGSRVAARTLVVAVGNLRPGAPDAFAPFTNAPWWHGNPWSEAAHRRCRDGERVLVIGSGLTMIDVCLSLASAGARPRITALSRHGLLPCIHDASDPATATPPRAGASLREVFRHVRAEAKRLMSQTGNWRPAIDCLRAGTPAIWSALSVRDQGRFLRRLRTYWDVHRHRVPAEVVGRIVELRQARVLRLVGANVSCVRDLGQSVCVEWRERSSGACVTGQFDRVINCTGARTSIEASPLLRSMEACGAIRAEPSGLGVLTDASGRALRPDGSSDQSLLVLGPLRRGTLWESSAVPELRGQAAEVARLIMRSIDD